MKTINPKHYPFIAFLMTVSIFYLSFLVTGYGVGQFMIARSDLLHQYLAYINKFGEVIRGNGSYWFSWSNAMGSGTAFEYANVALSPFNIIFYVLGSNHLLTAATIIIFVKTGTAAVTYQIFATRFFNNKSFSTVFFGVMYALCGFTVCYYINIMWLDAILLFPLLVLCLKYLIEEKKFFGLTFGLIYLFGVNFYAAYMAGIGLFFFFLAYVIYATKLLGIRGIVDIITRFFVSVFVALGVTAIIWLPAALKVIGDGRRSISEAIWFNSGNNIFFAYGNLMIGQNQTLNGIIPFVYCGLPSLLLAHLYFFNRRLPRRERLVCGGLLLFLFSLTVIPPLNIAMHGFDIPTMFNFRYSYIISFLIVSLACRQSLYLKKTNLIVLTIIIFINLGLYFILIFLMPKRWDEFYSLNTYIGLLINFLFLMIWFGLLYYYKKGNLKRHSIITLIILALFAELLVNAATSIKKLDHFAFNQSYFGILAEAERNSIAIMNDRDAGWYRTDYRGMQLLNSGLMYGYQTLDFFTSGRNSALVSMFRKVGHFTGGNAVFRSGQTEVVNTLLGVKYQINGLEMAEDKDIPYQPISLREFVLGPAYMVNEDILKLELDASSPFGNHELLLSSMLGYDVKVYESVKANFFALRGIIKQYENGIITLESDENDEVGGHFRLEVPPDDKNRRLLAYIDRIETDAFRFAMLYTPDVIKNNEIMHVPPRLDQPRIIELGIGESGNFELDIHFPYESYIDYFSAAYFRFYDEAAFSEVYYELKREQLYITDWGEGYLKGTISISGDKEILFTSIPYDKGWKAFVNGFQSEVIPLIDGALCGIRLPAQEGTYEIVMLYEAHGKKTGMFVSSISLILLGLLWFFQKKNISKK